MSYKILYPNTDFAVRKAVTPSIKEDLSNCPFVTYEIIGEDLIDLGDLLALVESLCSR